MAKGKSLLLGFVIGGTVSAIATLLSTPSSGKDLRDRVKYQSSEWKEMIMNLRLDGLRLKNQLAETSKEGAALVKALTQDMKKRSEEHTSELQSRGHLVCRLLLEKKKQR